MMTNRTSWRRMVVSAGMMLTTGAGTTRAEELPIVTGEHWTHSSEELQKVYLVAIANVIQIETTYEGANRPSDVRSLVPRLANGLKGQTLNNLRDRLDHWYAAHPDRLRRPVLETLWFEVVVPGLVQ